MYILRSLNEEHVYIIKEHHCGLRAGYIGDPIQYFDLGDTIL